MAHTIQKGINGQLAIFLLCPLTCWIALEYEGIGIKHNEILSVVKINSGFTKSLQTADLSVLSQKRWDKLPLFINPRPVQMRILSSNIDFGLEFTVCNSILLYILWRFFLLAVNFLFKSILAWWVATSSDKTSHYTCLHTRPLETWLT